MSAIQQIRDAGFQVRSFNDGFKVEPKDRLNSKRREFLREHKAEIVMALNAERYSLDPDDYCKLMQYMEIIEETDIEMIDELLNICSRDSYLLESALSHADKLLLKAA